MGPSARWSRRKVGEGPHITDILKRSGRARASGETQAALRESEERLALALDATRLGLWEYDIVLGVLDWSPRIREMYGVGVEEPVDFETFVDGVHPEDRERVLAAYGEAAVSGGDFSFEHRLAHRDETERWLLSHGRVLTDENGKAVRALGTAMDITDRKQAEADNRLLLDELNHRVKNSFATVASLLTLRAKRSRSEEARQQLTEALNQVMSIAQAYAHLYAGGQPRSLDVADYLRDLCNGLADGMLDGERTRLTVRADSATMETDRALPLGMAVNELVTNAIKYAFPDGRSGLIEVAFETAGEGWRLSIADDGVGLPEDYEQQRGAGVGLVKSFARQAGARLRILGGPGARFEIASI